MSGFVAVAKVGEIEEGQVKVVRVGDASVGVANVDGEYFAFADVCTHVGILKRGRLVRAGSLDAIAPLRDEIVITVNRVPTPQTIAALHPGIVIDGNTLVLNGDAGAQKAAVLRALLEMGADIRTLSHQRATLEEIYLEAMR